MSTANITKVYLLDVPLEKDYKNTLYFANATAQYNYFYSKKVKSYTDFTYQRKDNIIRIPDVYDNIYTCNYVMYQNTNYGNKWFYCFIDKMEYINDGRTDIHISTDVIQTWLFNYTIKPSFVEREHVNDDTIGLHTIPENVDTGEYILSGTALLYAPASGTNVCIMTTDLPDQVKATTGYSYYKYGGILSGCYMLIPKPSSTFNADVTVFCNLMSALDKANAIIGIFVVPNNLIPSGITYNDFSITEQNKIYNFSMGILPSSISATELSSSTSLTPPTTIDGYTPHNNKLKCWPYSYFYITNNVGSDIEFHYEDFVNNTATFKTVATITPGCSIRTIPLNYKKLTDSGSTDYCYNYGIPVGKYPICSWRSDLYLGWLKENTYNLGLTIGGGVASIGGGVALLVAGAFTGAGAVGGIGMIAGGVGAISSAMVQKYQHRLTPEQGNGNTNTNDVTFSAGKIETKAHKMTIRSEYAQIIDQYFDMFGYKVNTVKTPNSNHRSQWWYTKTIDVNIDGNIPDEDIQKIKDCYNNGITFWKNASNIGNYSLSNAIVTP